MSPPYNNSEESPDKAIVPLDFKATTVDKGKLVIKAKPLLFSPEEEKKQAAQEVIIETGKDPNIVY